MGGIVSPRDSPQACFYTISTVLQTGARKTSKTCVYSLQDSDTHYCISVHEDCSIAFSKLQPSLLIDWFVGDWWAWVINSSTRRSHAVSTALQKAILLPTEVGLASALLTVNPLKTTFYHFDPFWPGFVHCCRWAMISAQRQLHI